MKITKYEHACLVLEDQGKKLVIDPGIFTASLPELENVCAVIITHAHADHLSLDHVDKILLKNPGIKIYTVAEVGKELGERQHEIVNANTSEICGTFHVSFYGQQHALIHKSIPQLENTGIMVNDTLYYPGDSLTLPHVPIKILATPASAPWLKMSELIDFIVASKPEQFFPTHDSLLSEVGHQVNEVYYQEAARAVGAKYITLNPGDSLEV